MKILFSGLLIFCFSLVIHVAVWKLRRPKRQFKTLAGIFSGVFAAGTLSFFRPGGAVFSPGQYLHLSLFFFSLVLVYLSFYTLIEADSPSFLAVLRVREAGREGLSADKLEFTAASELVTARLDDLVCARMVSFSDGKFKLNSRGRMFVLPFIFYRRLLGLKKGG